MDTKLVLYNTKTRKKEPFQPLNPPFAGIYVCGPTVYGDAHLGHARPALTFDLLYRFLKQLGYKVRYVRNITDVGHLENDADEGEDKIGKKARLEKLEPMEIVQYYSNRYHENMRQMNVLPPDIEPLASGHIIEQQQMIRKILDNGFAYEVNGSVYFDMEKFQEKYNSYGKLSGRVLDDLKASTRALEGQDQKKSSYDFALWKKASPEHIMRWASEWSEGFPGWHLECSVMSAKYLGDEFDIHGGGMDLLFPHHECEIAQSMAANGKEAVKYWIHNNMITINGKKMGKSLGNFITLNEFFAGEHDLLEKAYSPMTIRFFILQAHYRSTLDFSNEALQAAEKGLERLFSAMETLKKINPSEKSTVDTAKLQQQCNDAMNDDLNSAVLIAHLFDGVKTINNITEGKETVTEKDLKKLQTIFRQYVIDILGLVPEEKSGAESGLIDGLMQLLLQTRQEAKQKKDFTTADKIRDELNKMGFKINDAKDSATWKYSGK